MSDNGLEKITLSPENQQKWDLARLEYSTNLWAKRGKSFTRAREIWLWCMKNDYDVPETVLDVFIEGIKKQCEDHKIKHPKKIIKDSELEDLDLLIFLTEYYSKHERTRGSQTRAFEEFAEIMEKETGETWTYDRVKTRYARTMKDLKK